MFDGFMKIKIISVAVNLDKQQDKKTNCISKKDTLHTKSKQTNFICETKDIEKYKKRMLQLVKLPETTEVFLHFLNVENYY